jgi:hypothetical protein
MTDRASEMSPRTTLVVTPLFKFEDEVDGRSGVPPGWRLAERFWEKMIAGSDRAITRNKVPGKKDLFLTQPS